jgi:hypothetical protein
MRGDAMEVMIVGHVLTRIGNGLKDYSSKKEDNRMPFGKTKMFLAMFTIA